MLQDVRIDAGPPPKTNPPKTNPRKSNPRETIRRILEAAAEEFAERGIEGARIEHVAQRAGVTKQLVYYYFQTKPQLYEAALDAISEQAVEEILTLRLDDLPPLGAIQLLFSSIFEQYRTRRNLAMLTLDQNLHHCAHISRRGDLRRGTPKIVAKFAHLVEAGLANGEIREGVDPESYFAFAFVMLTGCFFSGPTLSVYIDRDFTSEAGIATWGRNALAFLLDGLQAQQRSSACPVSARGRPDPR
jgi:AcrR family transcriptional regulator